MLKRLAVALVFMLPGLLLAQQEPQFSQYMFGILGFNPGYAGSRDAICATGLYRQQWAGLKDMDGEKIAPLSYTINIDAPVPAIRGGVGASITSDKVGYEENISVKLGYAYHRTVGIGDLGIGLMVNFLDKSLDFSKLEPIEEDPLLTRLGTEREMIIDLSLGAFYVVPNQYYIGLSSTQLLQSKSRTLSESDNALLKMKLRRHFFLTAGYTYTLPNHPEFEMEPSILFKSDGASLQLDLTGVVKYNNRFWGGISYRYQDAIVAMIGMTYKDFRIGYSYDITTSSLGSYSGGSHEIMAGYCFKLLLEKVRQSYKNTRFL